MNDDSIKRLADQYKQRLSNIEDNDKTFRAKQELLKTVTPKRWAALRKLIKEKRDAFNVEMGRDVLSWDDNKSDRLSMTRIDDGATVAAHIEEKSQFITVSLPGTTVIYEPQVNNQDVTFVLTGRTDRRPRTIEEIASQLFQDFMTS